MQTELLFLVLFSCWFFVVGYVCEAFFFFFLVLKSPPKSVFNNLSVKRELLDVLSNCYGKYLHISLEESV